MRRRRSKAAVTVKVGKRTLRGDSIVRTPEEFVLIAGDRTFWISRAANPIVEIKGKIGGSNLSHGPQDRSSMADAVRAALAVQAGPQVTGGVVEIKRRREAAAARRGEEVVRNQELEEMMGGPLGINE